VGFTVTSRSLAICYPTVPASAYALMRGAISALHALILWSVSSDWFQKTGLFFLIWQFSRKWLLTQSLH